VNDDGNAVASERAPLARHAAMRVGTVAQDYLSSTSDRINWGSQ
jgi:hypothetical protein